jgi:hypothetical protein
MCTYYIESIFIYKLFIGRKTLYKKGTSEQLPCRIDGTSPGVGCWNMLIHRSFFLALIHILKGILPLHIGSGG